MARYNKQNDLRDQEAARYVESQPEMYSEHSDKHLYNALRYAKGCGGSESLARRKVIKAEMRRRR